MNHKSISPTPQQPVDRVPAAQLPTALAELSEAELSVGSTGVLPLGKNGEPYFACNCSYDGDDE